MQRNANLRNKIATHEKAAEAATLELKQLLAAANFEKTNAVNKALFKKSNTLAIAEELREALADSERKTLPLRASASRAAQHYANAHNAAYGAYARLEAYKGPRAVRRGAHAGHGADDACIGAHAHRPARRRSTGLPDEVHLAATVGRGDGAARGAAAARSGGAGAAGAGGVYGACVSHAGNAVAAGGGGCDGLSVNMNRAGACPGAEKRKAPAVMSEPFSVDIHPTQATSHFAEATP